MPPCHQQWNAISDPLENLVTKNSFEILEKGHFAKRQTKLQWLKANPKIYREKQKEKKKRQAREKRTWISWRLFSFWLHHEDSYVNSVYSLTPCGKSLMSAIWLSAFNFSPPKRQSYCLGTGHFHFIYLLSKRERKKRVLILSQRWKLKSRVEKDEELIDGFSHWS